MRWIGNEVIDGIDYPSYTWVDKLTAMIRIQVEGLRYRLTISPLPLHQTDRQTDRRAHEREGMMNTHAPVHMVKCGRAAIRSPLPPSPLHQRIPIHVPTKGCVERTTAVALQFKSLCLR